MTPPFRRSNAPPPRIPRFYCTVCGAPPTHVERARGDDLCALAVTVSCHGSRVHCTVSPELYDAMYNQEWEVDVFGTPEAVPGLVWRALPAGTP